jgi:hypothetical protein
MILPLAIWKMFLTFKICTGRNRKSRYIRQGDIIDAVDDAAEA